MATRPRPAERAAMLETHAIYRHADAAYAPFSCPASGECCQLAQTGREPHLWEPEWLVLREQLLRESRPLPALRTDGACPFLDVAGKRCSVYANRPLGCRTYFCARVRGPSREPVERMGELLTRLAKVAQELDPDAAGPRPLTEWVSGAAGRDREHQTSR